MSRQRGRSERATRQQGHHNLAWPDARVTLAAQAVLHVPSQRPSLALHPAQLTAFIKAIRSTRDLADVVNKYAQHFNEVRVHTNHRGCAAYHKMQFLLTIAPTACCVGSRHVCRQQALQPHAILLAISFSQWIG